MSPADISPSKHIKMLIGTVGEMANSIKSVGSCSEVNIEYREPHDDRTYRDVAVTSSARINQPQNYSRFRYTESRRDTYQENSGGALSGRPIDTWVTSPNERVRTKMR